MVNFKPWQALFIVALFCFSCAEKFRALESNRRVHDEICVKFGVPASIHTFHYKDRLTKVTVELKDRPESGPDTVRSAVRAIVRKEFPEAQNIIVNIPPKRLPSWSPQNMLVSCPDQDVQADGPTGRK